MSIERYKEDRKVIQRLLDRQAACDWEGVRETFAEDAVFELPFVNERFSGRERIIERWRPSLERMAGARFFDLALRPLSEPGWYVAEFRNSCTVKTTGLPYDQLYIAIFHVCGGKIALFREFFDPLRLAIALKRVRLVE